MTLTTITPERKLPQNIWCIGRNYAEHAHELGNAVPSVPLIFAKAVGCLTWANEVSLPAFLEEVHHELEIVLRFSDRLEPGTFCFNGMALGLDLTDRQAQSHLKTQGQPWELAKSFINAAPISDFIPVQPEEFAKLSLKLEVNQSPRQKGEVSQMIFSAPQIAQYLLARFPVKPGDYLMTGTPSGVAALRRGDRAQGSLSLGTNVLLQHTWKIV